MGTPTKTKTKLKQRGIFKSYISFQKDFFMAPEINDYLPIGTCTAGILW